MTRAILTALLVISVTAGTPAIQQPVFRSGVDLVRVDVSVMRGTSPVSGLTADNFTVIDNGVPQKLDSVSLDRVPLSLTLVLDISGSMAGERMAGLIDATTALARALRPDDAAALSTFSGAIHKVVPATVERQPLLNAIARLEPGGITSLNDAVFFGLQLRGEDAGDSRPVLLLFSDGRDTSSWLTNSQVIEATRRSGMLVHVVELIADRYSTPSEVLDELASAGGGRRWRANSARDLRELFGRVLDELRSRYLLSYYPVGSTREGWHDVKVTLKGARGDVTARPGYFVAR